jgi:CelD/BcsL family acetyltransferase involved in cellulose biosynthesis
LRPPPREVPLKFRFGDWCLYEHQFKGIVWPENSARLVSLETLAAAALEPGVDVLFAPSVPVPSPLAILTFGSEMIRYVPAQFNRYYLELTGDFKTLLRGLSRHRRQELQRKVRRFAERELSVLPFREYRHPVEMAEFHSLARQVSRRSYQRRLGAGLPDDTCFWNELATRAESDGVRGFVLFDGRRPAAYQLCYAHGDCLSGVYCGYDRSLRKCSPGAVLLYCVLGHLFEQRRFKTFDFGAGEQAYKEVFATSSTFCADIYYLRRTPTNLCLVWAHRALHSFWSAIARVLDAVGAKKRLRAFIRRRPIAGSVSSLAAHDTDGRG